MRTNSFAGLLLFAVAGCSNTLPTYEVSLNHPASSQARIPRTRPNFSALETEPAQTMQLEQSGPPAEAGSLEGVHEQHGGQEPLAAKPTNKPLFACPMHPEVTSADPEARCPKCNMKINEPVRKKSANENSLPEKGAHGGHSH